MDYEKLQILLLKYKESFQRHWNAEKYKWQAIQHFQTHWDEDSNNFAEMFSEAIKKTGNLLASQNHFPGQMIIDFANADQEITKNMFRELYNEKKDIKERVKVFIESANYIQKKYNNGNWRNHYQNTNSVSTYLWLKYPDKYYIYKYSLAKKITNLLSADIKIKRNGSSESMINGFHLYDLICHFLKNDIEIKDILHEKMDASCYPDPMLKTTTIDFCYYLNSLDHNDNNFENLDPIDAPCEKTETIAMNKTETGYWWLNANPRIWSFANTKIDEIQNYTLYNKNGNKRRIFQNFLDAKAGDKIIGYDASPIKKSSHWEKLHRAMTDTPFFSKKQKTFPFRLIIVSLNPVRN